MVKILITGGAGFIGSNLIKHILKEREKILIYSFDNYSTGKKITMRHPNKLFILEAMLKKLIITQL